jgi:hypothetical protein
MLKTDSIEEVKPRVSGSIYFSENSVIYEIMRENKVEPVRSQMTIWSGKDVICMPDK